MIQNNKRALHRMKFINSPCSDMQGTRFLGRAKPMPMSRTLGDFFEKDILADFRLRAVPTRSRN